MPAAPLKAFISYAHDDARMLANLRRHLAATEQAFGIPLWADGSLQAGHHWNNTIHRAINKADLFLLLLSPAYLASPDIRDHKIRAIAMTSVT